MNAFATAVSLGLQYGVPLEVFVVEVQLHALRAGGHDEQPGDPVRQVDARLHHALARQPRSSTTPTTHEELGILTQEVRARKEAAAGAVIGADTAGPATATATATATANGHANGASRPRPVEPAAVGADRHARRSSRRG